MCTYTPNCEAVTPRLSHLPAHLPVPTDLA
jgi:hypothetical protein